MATNEDRRQGGRDVQIPRTSLTRERPSKRSTSDVATTRRSGVERATDEYAGAFARVRLVRAWIAAAAALVAMLYAYVALLERVIR
jgi:hypothetical protein